MLKSARWSSRPLRLIVAIIIAVGFVLSFSHPTIRQQIPTGISSSISSAVSYPSAWLGQISNNIGDRPIRIVFSEAKGAHDEVLAALQEAWGSIPNAQLDTFKWQLDMFGAQRLYESLPLKAMIASQPHDIRTLHDWSKENAPPDILIITTSEYFPWDNIKPLLQDADTHIFCVIHRTEQWPTDFWTSFFDLERKMSPWIKAGRIEFLTLGPHVAKTVYHVGFSQWKVVKEDGHEPVIHVLAPLFTTPLPPVEVNNNEVLFAIQGYFNNGRRNYGLLFKEMSEAQQKLKATQSTNSDPYPEIKLHLVGHADDKLTWPKELDVTLDEDLPYSEYYALLSRMTAIIPAFQGDDYFDKKASSTVPASLIAGAPLVATRRILDTYTYLNEDAVWIQDVNETDVEVVMRVVKSTAAERKRKLQTTRDSAKMLVKVAGDNAREWTRRVLEPKLRKEQSEEAEAGETKIKWESGKPWFLDGKIHLDI